MAKFSRRVLIAGSAVVVIGCGAEAEPNRPAARSVTTTAVLASPDVAVKEKDQAREVRQDVERGRLLEAVRVAAAAKAAEDARLVAAAAEGAAAQAVAAEAAASQVAAAERASAERAAEVAVAARAARTRAPVPAPAPAQVRASRSAPVAAPRAATPAAPQPAAAAPVAAPVGQGGFEGEVLALTNAARSSAGLRPLQSNGCAQSRARTWSQQMAAAGIMSHQALGPVMTGCGARGAAENVAFGNISAAQMVTNWMNSPGHRANILNPSYTHLGVGMAERSDGRRYGTQVFLTL